eukprot:TRINITY_DN14961_c0_g1_i1.p1 TRINITY_DN14961_c0_g1~~TRINITY_DN14961_c0_g1_i1.p1  ORF type:complete len:936 (+),score=237.16 TRINITY_DN14961_c0_g1_i1:53-2860(+)
MINSMPTGSRDRGKSKVLSQQIQMNIATACMSARYTEVARKAASKERSPASAAFVRKGSPAARPRVRSGAGGTTTTVVQPFNLRTSSPSSSPRRAGSPSIRTDASQVGSHGPIGQSYASASLSQSVERAESTRRSLPTSSFPGTPRQNRNLMSSAVSPSLDYLNKVTSISADVSPLVRNVSKNLERIDDQISDSLRRSKESHSPVKQRQLQKELHYQPASTMRCISPPRNVVKVKESEEQLAAQKAHSLETLYSELGRVRTGIGAGFSPYSNDWEWSFDSPAYNISNLLIETHEHQWEQSLWSMQEMLQISSKSCTVFRTSALLRDLSVTEHNITDFENLKAENERLRQQVDEASMIGCGRYKMKHPEMEETIVLLKEDGSHVSDYGRGSWSIERLEGGLSMTLSWKGDSSASLDNIRVFTSDHGRLWQGATITLTLVGNLPHWIRAEALASELNSIHRTSSSQVERSAQLEEEVSRLQQLLLSKSEEEALTEEQRERRRDAEEKQREKIERERKLEEEIQAEERRLAEELAAEERRVEEERKAEEDRIRREEEAAFEAERLRIEEEQKRQAEELNKIEEMRLAKELRRKEEQRFEEEVLERDRQQKRLENEEAIRKSEELRRATELELAEEKRLLELELQKQSQQSGLNTTDYLTEEDREKDFLLETSQPPPAAVMTSLHTGDYLSEIPDDGSERPSQPTPQIPPMTSVQSSHLIKESLHTGDYLSELSDKIDHGESTASVRASTVEESNSKQETHLEGSLCASDYLSDKPDESTANLLELAASGTKPPHVDSPLAGDYVSEYVGESATDVTSQEEPAPVKDESEKNVITTITGPEDAAITESSQSDTLQQLLGGDNILTQSVDVITESSLAGDHVLGPVSETVDNEDESFQPDSLQKSVGKEHDPTSLQPEVVPPQSTLPIDDNNDDDDFLPD